MNMPGRIEINISSIIMVDFKVQKQNIHVPAVVFFRRFDHKRQIAKLLRPQKRMKIFPQFLSIRDLWSDVAHAHVLVRVLAHQETQLLDHRGA